MSDLGLYSGIYEQLRSYADNIDLALVNLKSDDATLKRNAREELSALFREISAGDSDNPSIGLIGMVLRQQLGGDLQSTRKTMSHLSEVLETRMPDAREMDNLEKIALAIERECSRTSERMRGRA